MRLTREMLLKAAQDTANKRARQDRDLLAVYLSGSLLEEEYLLGGAADLDLFLIHADPYPVEREVERLTEDVHLDIAHYSHRDYRDTRRLRVHPWIGPALTSCKVLYDPQHFMDFTQASVRGQFDRPDHVSERAGVQAEQARQIWWGLQTVSPQPEPAVVRAYLRAVGLAANAIASLSGPPLTERRLLLHFPARAAALDQPGLYQGLLGLLGAPRLEDQDIEAWLPHWQTAFQSLPTSQAPARLHPYRLNYYLGAFRELIRNESPSLALWPVLCTWTEMAELTPQDSPTCQAWRSIVTQLGLYGPDFLQHVAGLDSYLDLVEESLETWARENGA